MNRHRRIDHQKVILSGVSALHILENLNQFAAATELHREARKEEKGGHPFTAAMKWRKAAGMFTEEFLTESCWCEWERIMKLPRSLSNAI